MLPPRILPEKPLCSSERRWVDSPHILLAAVSKNDLQLGDLPSLHHVHLFSTANRRTDNLAWGLQVAAHRVKLLFGLAQLPSAAELHGNMSQTGRLEALDDFRQVLFHLSMAAVACAVAIASRRTAREDRQRCFGRMIHIVVLSLSNLSHQSETSCSGENGILTGNRRGSTRPGHIGS